MPRCPTRSAFDARSEPALLCDLVASIAAHFPPPRHGRRALTYAAVRAADDPLVRATLATFPGAEIVDVRETERG